MRLVTYCLTQGEARPGALSPDGSFVIDLAKAWDVGPAPTPAPASLQALIEAGPVAWDHARHVIAHASQAVFTPLADVQLLSPLPRPIRMRDFSAFEAHAAIDGRLKLAPVWYEWPVYYKCNAFAVIGPDTEVLWPAASNEIDFELELAMVIGKGGKGISRDDARDHIFGFMVFNDLSARDWQMKEMPVGLGPARGKDFDGANVLGPVLVTLDEIGDPYALTMIARINGEEWSRGSSGSIHHRFEDMIAFVSEGETLVAGEVFGSGTVGGGCGYELQRLLSRGDLVELEIEKIGVLRTRIV